MTISLAFLAPNLMQAAIEGRLPHGISVTRLRDPAMLGPFITQTGARNGFAEPRDREPKSGLTRPQRTAETAGPQFKPARMPATALVGMGHK
jgi:hypothetical protein